MSRWTGQVRRTVLPNGLTILVQRDSSAPAASVITHVRAGFFDEPDRLGGISHVLEHMFFKGTPRRGPGDIARETKSAGGYLNAGTGYDHTTYYVVLPAASLPAAVDIQSDALRHSLIDPDELAREIQVIIQEARRKLDSPASVAHETLNQVLFDRHRIRRWRIGHEDVLAGFTRDDVFGYYRSRYVPRRTIVSIVGDCDEDEALGLVEDAYGDWEDRPGDWDPSPAEPAHAETRVRTLRGDVTHSHLTLGWQAVPPLHPDAPALDLAAAVLGMGRGSWLYRALRETGITTSAAAYFHAPTEVGLFGISAETAPDRVPDAMEIIGRLAATLADRGPDHDDLERARTLLLTRWARQLETTDGRASALAAAESLKHVSWLDEEYEALLAVTGGQVREVAARYLGGDRVSALVYHPEREGQDLDADRVRSTFRVNGVVRGGVLPDPRPPAVVSARGGKSVAGVTHLALPGVDLLVRPKRGTPSVSLGLYALRPGGEPNGQGGVGALGARASVRGAGGLTAAELAFAFERLGGTLGVSSAADWLGFTTTVLARNLGEVTELLRMVVTEATLDEGDLARERQVMIEEAEQVQDDMFRYPFQLAFAAAFGDQGYGVPVHGVPETLAGLGPDDVRRYHRQVFAGRLLAVAVGEFDSQEALDQLAGVLGALPARERHSLPGPQRWIPDAAPSVRVVRRDKAQTAMAMAFPGPARRDPRRYAAEVLAAVASGLGGRLFESLRSRRSLAYTVMATHWARAGAGALATYIGMAPGREEEAREEMLRELERFTREPVTDRELHQATRYLSGQEQVSQQSALAVLAQMMEAWLIGEGLDELAEPGAPYLAVTAEEVRRIAEEYLDPSRRAEGLVRGRS